MVILGVLLKMGHKSRFSACPSISYAIFNGIFDKQTYESPDDKQSPLPMNISNISKVI